MFVAEGSVIYSASDLAAAARCEYVLLRSFDAHLGFPAAFVDLTVRAVNAGRVVGYPYRRATDLLSTCPTACQPASGGPAPRPSSVKRRSTSRRRPWYPVCI